MKKDDGYIYLKLGNIPEKLNNDEYCLECQLPTGNWEPISINRTSIETLLVDLYYERRRYRYRPIQKAKVSHEELADQYAEKQHPYPTQMVKGIGIEAIIDGFRKIAKDGFIAGFMWCASGYEDNCKSATIPPEQN